jgi:hypothetical protein
MTPQERQLIDDLFDRLAKVETTPRDPDAQAAIADGLRRAPNAVYALVQTVLVQDEALKQAEAHIRELEEGNRPQQQSGGFLDSMRDSLRGSSSRGSVPSVRPGESDAPPRSAVWNTGQTGYQPDPRATTDYRQGNPAGGGGLFGGGNPGSAPGGGSFLGTAAATAAGVIGGSMLMNSIRGMMGGGGHQAFGDTASSTKSPWDNNSQSGGDLARDAGLNDVGKSGRDDNSRQSLADNSSYDQNNDNDYDNNDDDDNDDDYDGDDDFGDGGDDSDFA